MPLSVVDTKLLPKPKMFKGDEAVGRECDWESWSFVLKAYAGAIIPTLRKRLENCVLAAGPDDFRNISLSAGDTQISAQL
mmetsp:Transcript_139262/g.445158  ORF Transcript_139262/g.445158 Transcript_139262/m.445158 type:complete len:80 (+) Transcript_139262:379-618(+)